MDLQGKRACDWIMVVGCSLLDSYDQMKEGEMGGSCSTHESDDMCVWPENLKGRKRPYDRR
jgi:hypothetical protein